MAGGGRARTEGGIYHMQYDTAAVAAACSVVRGGRAPGRGLRCSPVSRPTPPLRPSRPTRPPGAFGGGGYDSGGLDTPRRPQDALRRTRSVGDTLEGYEVDYDDRDDAYGDDDVYEQVECGDGRDGWHAVRVDDAGRGVSAGAAGLDGVVGEEADALLSSSKGGECDIWKGAKVQAGVPLRADEAPASMAGGLQRRGGRIHRVAGGWRVRGGWCPTDPLPLPRQAPREPLCGKYGSHCTFM